MISKIVLRSFLVLTLLIIGIAGYLFYDNYLHERIVLKELKSSSDTSTSKDAYTPPLELSGTYDSSEVPGKFRVYALDYDNKKITLIYDWPQIKKDSIIRPILKCNPLDTKLFERGSKVPSFITNQKLLQIIRDTNKNQMLFSGICEDEKCEVINHSCELYINSGIKE